MFSPRWRRQFAKMSNGAEMSFCAGVVANYGIDPSDIKIKRVGEGMALACSSASESHWSEGNADETRWTRMREHHGGATSGRPACGMATESADFPQARFPLQSMPWHGDREVAAPWGRGAARPEVSVDGPKSEATSQAAVDRGGLFRKSFCRNSTAVSNRMRRADRLRCRIRHLPQ